MSIWRTIPDLSNLNLLAKDSMIGHLGIEIYEIGEDYIRGRMPVNNHTRQPFGILHGGASVALAESIGSFASGCCIDSATKIAVGLDINANHIRSVPTGNMVIGTARPLHIGASTHVWDIRIETDSGKLVCISRLTMAIIDRRDG